MGVAFIVSLIALSGLHLARLQLRVATGEEERLQAQQLARSAIEHAVTQFYRDPDWQSTFSPGVDYPSTPVQVNGGSFTWRLVNQGSGRRLEGTGRHGRAAYTCAVDLGTNSTGCLAYGLLCDGNLTVGDATVLEELTVANAAMHCNATLTNWATIKADVEAAVIQNNGTITGTQSPSAPNQPLPDPGNVFDYYESRGTKLPTASLQDCLLSPSNNPWGEANPDGIYVIDAAGLGVSIKRCRIVGTLVVLNVGEAVSLDEEINWEPARPNYPALLVQGSIGSRITDRLLAESAIGVNLNPESTPYQGATDSSTDDEYPSAIAGILYCTQNLVLDGKNDTFRANYQGVLMAGGTCQLTKGAKVSIDWDPTFGSAPPPGFGAGDARSIVPGSWRQMPSP